MPVSNRARYAVYLLAFGLAALILGVGVFVVTERYIERQRPVTLVYRPHPFRRQVLVPEQKYQRGRVAFDIGPHGWRGSEPEMPKPPGTLRIIALGGSSVFDHLVTGGASWPERIGPLLQGNMAEPLRDLGWTRVESYNGGVPGYSSRETLATYHDLAARYAPDLVLFYLGWNDAKYMVPFLEGADPDRYYSYRGAFEAQYRFLLAPRPWRNLAALGKMWTARVGALAENRSAVAEKARVSRLDWDHTPGLEYWRRNVRAFGERVLQDGALPVFIAQNTLTVPGLSPELRKRVVYRYVGLEHDALVAVNEAMVRGLAAESAGLSVPFLDLRGGINGREDFFSDHVHMKAAGSEAFARALAEALEKVLPRLAASTSTAGRTSAPD